MVFWLKKHYRICFLITSALIAFLFCIPYIFKDLLPVEHDTFFHLSRIEGLSNAISHMDFLPAVYPDKNGGYGYASPLFYCDLFLYPEALLYLAGVPLSLCYKAGIFLETTMAAFTVQCLLYRISSSVACSVLSAVVYTFSNYHITDVYVRGAFGEVQAMIFLPMLLEGMYLIFHEKQNRPVLYIFSLAGLLLSHNLTFLMGVILIVVFAFFYLKDQQAILNCLKGSLMAFLLTVFFSLPMLEQLHSNTFNLNYYASSSDLASGSLPLWKYFANRTVFGYSANTLPHEKQMVLNVGCFLTCVPLLMCAFRKKNRFVSLCTLLGYVCMLLPCSLVPWGALSFLRVLQFPWRLLQIAMVLLTVSSCYALSQLHKKYIPPVLGILCLIEGMYHVFPVFTRTFGMTSTETWSDVLEGKLVDPYYSATYMRVELAGGDYLPLPSADYRKLPQGKILSTSYTPLSDIQSVSYSSFSFSLNCEEEVLLPKTWYKGYHVYKIMEDGTEKEIPCHAGKGGLIEIHGSEGTYLCTYSSTPLRKTCILLSLFSLLFFLLSLRKKTVRKTI